MCRVGDFNQSHASMTSPAALAALRDLSVSNLTLYREFMITSRVIDTSESEPDPVEPDLEQNTTVDDESDIPLHVAIEHIISGSSRLPDGFTQHEDGALTRSAVVENPDLDVNTNKMEEGLGEGLNVSPVADPVVAPPAHAALGRGHRTKKVSRHYDSGLWEE